VETSKITPFSDQLSLVAARFDREYRRDPVSLPPEVESMSIFQDWASGKLQNRLASPFWEFMKPKKNDRCLDLGCGLSFLVFPCWREWNAYFYGQDVSTVAKDIINSRAPQLNSKNFKGVKQVSAENLDAYELDFFDWAIATGVSCYGDLDYWEQVLSNVKKVLKPGGSFIFDVVNPDADGAENWAILETYLGAEVGLESLSDWEKMIKSTGAKIKQQKSHECFELYRVIFD
jgi:SAM-dependent methyltransferase